jgi:methylamine--corrinoid protein Co-methyltransferase
MISQLEIAERAATGPRMLEMDWNMGLFEKMNELVERYEITVPAESSWDFWHNRDRDLADRALEAGIRFLAEAGAYCLQSERVVHFTEEEIRAAIAEVPRRVVIGEGSDARVYGERAPEELAATKGTGILHAPYEDQIAVDVARTFIESLDLDIIEGYNFRHLDGREIFGVPMEVAAARRQVARMRQAVELAGKPGMGIFYYPISTADAVLTAPIDPLKGLRTTDGVLLSLLPDVKLDLDMLAASIVYSDYGAVIRNGGGDTAAGGFCGGVAGAIVASVAKTILGWIAYRGVLAHGAEVRDIRTPRRTTIRVQPIYGWASSVCSQAVSRVSPVWAGSAFNTLGGIGFCSGPGTRTHLLEIAMASIGSGVAGGPGVAPLWHIATMNSRLTPYENQFAREVAEATSRAGMTEGDVPRLMKALTPKLEGKEVELGRDIRECWDIKLNRPLSWYLELGKSVQAELERDLGLAFQ